MYSNNTEDDLHQALEICKVPLTYSEINDMSTEMKLVLLYKYREISISDTLHIQFKCPSCGSRIDGNVNISNIYQPPRKESNFIIDPMRMIPPEEIDDYIIVPENEDFSAYRATKKDFDGYISHFDFYPNSRCLVCGKNDIKINIRDPKFCIENMSENTLSGLYSQINQMTHLSHYSYNDIMNMYPFERDILKGLLDKTIEKENERK